MPQQRLRAGVGVFLLLCCLTAVNLFALQGTVVARNSKLIAFPGSASSPAAPQNISEGPQAFIQDEGPAPPEPLPAPVPVTTGSVPGPDLIRAIQRELQVLGYEAGGIDGRSGLTTRAAIMAFEWDQGLSLTAEPAEGVFQALLLGGTRRATAGAASGVEPSAQAKQVIRFVQQGLAGFGYGGVAATGVLDAGTQQSIRLFEAHEGLPETGRISGLLTARITRLTAEKRLAVRR